jgi:phosphoribosylformylglycinamidine (FGAM) synthase-like amidotransferase family enzyme
MNPRVLITTGLGFNSHEELGYCFRLAGADVDFILYKEFLERPVVLDSYQGLGLPGGFTGGDRLGAGQFIANLTRMSPKAISVLENKLDDEKFPVIAICNSAQILANLGLYPIKVGTIQNDVGKHRTGFWDISVDNDCQSVWLDYVRRSGEPVFAPISHGEGRFYLEADDLKKAREQGMIAMRYSKGAMFDYFQNSRGETHNPNGSTDDIAGLAWKSNLSLFPHFERLRKNYQRPDREEAKRRGLDLKADYEPTMLLFKAAVDYMKNAR